MPNPRGSRSMYLNQKQAKILEPFSPEELVILIEEGKGLFELTMENPSKQEMSYLNNHPRLRRFVEKW